MSISAEIGRLIKGKIVIRHRNDEELSGVETTCILCLREMNLPPGSVCMVVGDEGLLCRVCCEKYAPDMAALLKENSPVAGNNSTSYKNGNGTVPTVSAGAMQELKCDLDHLVEVMDKLSRGIARGIVEAPAGHIGLMHYAKDIRKPPQKENESEKDYDLRVRTFRIARLYEKIREDTTERVERIRSVLLRYGFKV